MIDARNSYAGCDGPLEQVEQASCRPENHGFLMVLQFRWLAIAGGPARHSEFRKFQNDHAEQIIDAPLKALDLLSVTIESCVHVRLPHAVAVARSQQLVR